MAETAKRRPRKRRGTTTQRRHKAAGTTVGGQAKRRRGGAADDGDMRRRVIEAALALAADRGWRRVSLPEIAAQAGLAAEQVRAAFPSKSAIVNGLLRSVDEAVVAGGPADAGDSARDRLFDVLMRRFDALAPYKAGLGAILGDACVRPVTGLCALPRFLCSMALMLETAGLSARGIAGALRAKGLALIYANALRVWLGDDSPDLAKTMAALDRGLRRAETLAALCLGPAARQAAAQ